LVDKNAPQISNITVFYNYYKILRQMFGLNGHRQQNLKRAEESL